ncbi:helix-turn-helix transcriptional regulator [Geomonas oryzisoli]|uniref:Helix-turn-helix transcriptional regulator n=1 Tax=Geomonas oryzisoli TaxID=2847992 RepID=A0ABX8JAU2_9BACT|nr:helix-turn-helix transcriptional regulator [Geomonas oryzisoli]QWV94237.1 helix-turn-helix transcriptional regulator [Geomonas oryzisoli]
MPPKRKQQYRHLPAFILLALAQEPSHGGAVMNLLSQRMPLFRPDSAAVYRTLQQLEEEGQVASSWDTSGSGPARRVYRITEAGWHKLDGWREDIEARLAHLNYFLQTYADIRNHRS